MEGVRSGLLALGLCMLLVPGVKAGDDPNIDCWTACKESALAELEACIAAGGDREACWLAVEESARECVIANCPQEPPPPPPSPCDACSALKEQMFMECAGDANGALDPACMERWEQEIQACFAQCQGEPPPPPLGCEDLCAQHGAEMKKQCVRPDGSEDRECIAAVNARVEACIASCQQPPPPSPCDACSALKEQMLIECGGGANGALDPACMERWEQEILACFAQCQGEPPPPPVGCEDLCVQHGEAMKSQCVRDDGSPDPDCIAAVERRVEACIASCQQPPPPSPCDACSALKERMLLECAGDANGALDPACMERWEREIQACFERCQGEPPTPRCPEACRTKIVAEVEACLQDGGSREDCWKDFEQRVQACLVAECNIEPPPPPVPCEERCAQLQESLVQKCTLPDGSIDPQCQEMILREIEACTARCQGEPPPPPDPVGCEDRCTQYGEELKNRCIQEDGTVDPACLDAIPAMVERCLLACAGTPPPDDGEPPAPCDEDCVAKAEGLFNACIQNGGEERECRDRADGILGLCLERCSGQQPCESRCALAAQVVLMGCAMGGLPGEECRRLANLVLERCVVGCSPGPTCQDRCVELARSAVRECVARGGTEEECRAKAQEVIAACQANCDGEPVPPCDVQCEEKAEALAQECAARGDPSVDCAALRESFLAECQANHETDCAQEMRAGLTYFRPFLRGDSNRDGSVNVSDPVSLLDWLFRGGEEPPCKDASDANDDGQIDVSDPVSVLRYLFMGTADLPGPLNEEGQDATNDLLLCES